MATATSRLQSPRFETRRVLVFPTLQQTCPMMNSLSIFTNVALSMAALRKLYQMTVGVTQEGSYLVAPIYRRCEELGSARTQYLVSRKAVWHANVQLAADYIRVGGLRK